MNLRTEKLLSNGWSLVRDAGSAVGDAGHRVSTTLTRHYPQVKDLVSAGAGLAIAKRGAGIAVTAIRRHPMVAIAGVAALAGIGLAALVVSKNRREALARLDSDGDSGTRTRRVTARNMRATTTPRRAAPSKRTRAKPAAT